MAVQITGAQVKNSAIDSSKLADNSVTSTKISDSAVSSAKIADSAILATKISNLAVSTAKLANNAVTAAKADLSGTWSFTGATLQAANPSSASDVAIKSYVDGLVGSGVYWKEPARAASTANINLSNPGTDTFDGIQLTSGQRLLVKDQSTASQNGVYDFNGSGSALTRSDDANSASELNGLAIFVKEGTANADQGFVQTSEIANLGSDNVTFAQFTGLGQITAGDGLTKTGNRLDVSVGNGIQISGDAVVFRAGAGLVFAGSDVDVQVDDSSIEIDGSGNLQVKPSGITSSELAGNAVTTAKIADNAVTAAKIGWGMYQELTTVSGASTTTIDIARTLDSVSLNGVMVYKNGLALLNQTALGGSSSDNDSFSVSASGGAGGVGRITFGAALADSDSVLIWYIA